jgi:aryl-phospho-beta-D-glucosidase BglC (GH1 family)
MKGSTLLATLLGASVHAWMPQDRELAAFNRSSGLDKRAHSIPSWKIRGVNLGGWLISEPWMLGEDEWITTMGCNNLPLYQNSEFDCVAALTASKGKAAADAAFNGHYSRWITTDHIQQIHDAGLNTIRIPIGYWSLPSIVDSSEHFPTMDLSYLDNIIAKADSLGMFVVIDLHGAPGAQKVQDPFTGQVSFANNHYCLLYLTLTYSTELDGAVATGILFHP